MTNEPITQRFFEALDYLKRERKIRGINTYTTRYGIDRRNLLKVKNDPANRTLSINWLAYLVEDYSISARWLLTGSGSITE